MQKSNLTNLVNAIKSIPLNVEKALKINYLNELAELIIKYNGAMIIGRGTSYGIAMEASLKIRELSYINTLSIAAGEMKHGSIALVDDQIPIIALTPYDDRLFYKTLSNIQEIVARKGKVFAFTDCSGKPLLDSHCKAVIELEKQMHFVTPIIYNIPMQMLAYTLAEKKGFNPDQPRNLAKSVTVE